VMMVQLRKIQSEMSTGMEEKLAAQTEAELKHLDAWSRAQYEVNKLAQNIRTNLTELETRREEQKGVRTKESIRLKNQNDTMLTEAGVQWQLMRDALTKPSKKLDEQEIEERRAYTELLGKDLVELSKKNQGAEGSEDPRFEVEEKKLTREQRREARKKGKRPEINLAEAKTYDRDATPGEQQFESVVRLNVEDQNKILTEIETAVNEWHDVALTMHTHLEAQGEKISAVDAQADKTLFQMEKANNRLQTVLEKSGGMSRWCPLLLCVILLLSLAGYFFNLLEQPKA